MTKARRISLDEAALTVLAQSHLLIVELASSGARSSTHRTTSDSDRLSTGTYGTWCSLGPASDPTDRLREATK
jgi:hypothetical protein